MSGTTEFWSFTDEVEFLDKLGTHCEVPKTAERIIDCLRGYIAALHLKATPTSIVNAKSALIARAELRIRKLTQIESCVPTGRQGVSISLPLSARP